MHGLCAGRADDRVRAIGEIGGQNDSEISALTGEQQGLIKREADRIDRFILIRPDHLGGGGKFDRMDGRAQEVA